MIIKTFNATNFTQVANGLARDPRLTLAATGLMTMILSYPSNYRLSVEGLLRELNKGQQKNNRIGKAGLRRLTQQMTDAGYLRIKSIHDTESGHFKGKEWHVHGISLTAKVPHDPSGDIDPEAIPILDQEQVVPDDLDLSDGAEPVAAPVASVPAEFPAAKVFMQVMDVRLDAETIVYIESQVTKDHDIWERSCRAHKAGMTPQQKSSEAFRTKAVKFCLEDYERTLDKIVKAGMVDQYKQGPFQQDEPKRKSFAEHIEQNSYAHGSPEYTKFKTNWVERHTAKGNAEALQEVEDYEGIRATLAHAKSRKGKLSQ